MHVLFLPWHFATQKLIYKILFGQRYILVYTRFYKNRSSLEKPPTEGAIKKIIFSSSISLYSYLKTIRWEPDFDKMFSEEKPELLGAIGEKVFYKTRIAGSNRRCLRKPELLGAIGDVYENPSCWEQSEVEMFLKTKYCPSGRPNN